MSERVIIVLPLPPKSLHAHNKGHWRGKAADVKRYRNMACMEAHCLIRDSHGRARMERATVSFDCYFPDARRRDALNFAHVVGKPAIDGIVDAGMLPDDNWRVVQIGHVRGHIDKDDPRVELTIEPLTENKQ